MTPVTFYFDYASPYSFLASHRIADIETHGGSVTPVPVAVLELQSLASNVPTSITCKAKAAYVAKDLQRWCRAYGIKMTMSKTFRKTDFALLLGIASAVLKTDRETFARVHGGIMQALWVDERDLTTSENIREALSSTVDASLIDKGRSPEIAAVVKANTSRAAEAGAFGTPTFQAGTELFFGNDRVDFLIQSLRGKQP